MLRYKDKVALVTGASAGIGATTALKLAQNGMKTLSGNCFHFFFVLCRDESGDLRSKIGSIEKVVPVRQEESICLQVRSDGGQGGQSYDGVDREDFRAFGGCH